MHKTPEKIQAVVDAPSPANLSQLRAFLGMINYYHRFLPDLSTRLEPLHHLLQKEAKWVWSEDCAKAFQEIKQLIASDLVLVHFNAKWVWSEDCAKAFQEIKQLIASDLVLVHFNPELPLTLSCDASPYGLGAVLSHIMPNGVERPVAYASRTLTTAERNYAQIDKEALAVAWGVKRFHQYLYGLHFTLVTDHQPLTALFCPERIISATTASRLQRQAVFLSGYSYTIKYRRTTQHANADALSRLPVPHEDSGVDTEVDVFALQQIDMLPITAMHLKRETGRDPQLSRVLTYVQAGWPKTVEDNVQIFFDKRQELTTEQGCLMWGMRVVIPQVYQQKVLEELHGGHLGVVKMKALARSHVWWPHIDKEIEGVTQRCGGCQMMKGDPKLTPLHPWEFPEGPWRRIHVDFAGPFQGKSFLIVVDAYSKWPEVVAMDETTTDKTVDALRAIFARWGIPLQMVTDNGPQFTSAGFERFLALNNIKHVRSSPYHPATNGLAERFVKTLKNALRVSKGDGHTLQHRLASFLLNYRNARHSTTEVTPATLMIGRDLRCRLSLLKPGLRDSVFKNVTRQIMSRSAVAERSFDIGNRVMVRDYRPGHSRWQPARVLSKLGSKSYRVETDGGGVWKRHADQMTATRIEKGTVDSEKGTTEEPGWEQGDPTAVIPEVPRPVVGDAVPGQLSDSVDKGSSAVVAVVPGLSDPQARDTGSAGKQTSTTLPFSQDTAATHPPTQEPDRPLCDGPTRSTIITRYGRTIKKPARYSDPDV